MANQKHIDIIKRSVEEWNEWRENNSSITPDLIEANLEGVSMEGANLKNAILMKANFRKANLKEANLSGSCLWRVSFEQANLEGANLRNCGNITENYSEGGDYIESKSIGRISVLGVIKGANFLEANLKGANLEESRLSGANFKGANLEGANLMRAYFGVVSPTELSFFRGANLEAANLIGANIREANLVGVNLNGTILNGANFEEAYLGKCYVCGILFDGVNLSGAKLVEVKLKGANLNGCNLSGANLSGVNLCGVNLSGAILVNANLKGANLEGVNLKEADLEKANFTGANLEGADLEGANITDTTFNKAHVKGATLDGDFYKHAILQKIDTRDVNWLSLNNAFVYQELKYWFYDDPTIPLIEEYPDYWCLPPGGKKFWMSNRDCPYCGIACKAYKDRDKAGPKPILDVFNICSRCGWWCFSEYQDWGRADDYTFCGESILKSFYDSTSLDIPLDELQKYLLKNQDKLLKIHPIKCEELVASVFSDVIGKVESCSYGRPDRGIDIVIIQPQDTTNKEKIAVQVKRYSHPIELSQIHQFGGAMIDNQFKKGIFVTTGRYRKSCFDVTQNIKFNSGIEIDLVDGSRLLDYIGISNRYKNNSIIALPKKLTLDEISPFLSRLKFTVRKGEGVLNLKKGTMTNTEGS